MTKLPLSRRRFLKVTAAGIASAGARVARAADNVMIGSVYGGHAMISGGIKPKRSPPRP